MFSLLFCSVSLSERANHVSTSIKPLAKWCANDCNTSHPGWIHAHLCVGSLPFFLACTVVCVTDLPRLLTSLSKNFSLSFDHERKMSKRELQTSTIDVKHVLSAFSRHRHRLYLCGSVDAQPGSTLKTCFMSVASHSWLVLTRHRSFVNECLQRAEQYIRLMSNWKR